MNEFEEANYLRKANEWWNTCTEWEKAEIWEKHHTFSVFKRTPSNVHVIDGWWRTLSNTEKLMVYDPELIDEMIDEGENNIYL